MRKTTDREITRRRLTDWGKVLLLLLDEAAVVLLVIVVLRVFEIVIPLPVAIVLALLLGAAAFAIHVTVIPSFHKRIVTGSEGMVGVQGRVVKQLNPVGTIAIKGEYWRAKSVEGSMEVDENAIRRASGNPNGRGRLVLPRIRTLERLARPKQTLHKLLLQACGLSRRRLDAFPVAWCAQRVSQCIDDFSPLRSLSAFNELETELQKILKEF